MHLSASNVANKKITLVLTYNVLLRTYKVAAISNSTYYKPGDILTLETVKIIETKTDWDFTASDDEFIKNIISKIPIPLPFV